MNTALESESSLFILTIKSTYEPMFIDSQLEEVAQSVLTMDPDGLRLARIFRATYDQLYDGQRTGRYRWDQLFKTEKTHFGTLFEINLQREFQFEDGKVLDFLICGYEVDSKYSSSGQWMLPPESFNHLILGATSSDEKSTWSIGLVRATSDNRNVGANRDAKSSLNKQGRSRIRWLFQDAPMQQNVLLHLPESEVSKIFSFSSGQARINQLFRAATGQVVSRNIIATVAQQDDFMKRVRENGGARSSLRAEGLVILGGDYKAQVDVARALGCAVPGPGEFVSLRIRPASGADLRQSTIEGRQWTLAEADYAVQIPAPKVPAR